MARHFLISATAAVTLSIASVVVVAPRASLAQVEPPSVENSRNSAECVINADNVYVRSGAGDNYYPTMKLNKGQRVTVIGEKFEWLKILPPEGSFSYVAKAFVDKSADGVGKVNRDDVNVRAGSMLNVMKTTVQSKLAAGQEVRILDDVDEYYKIAPPADAAVYVKKEFADLERVIPQVAKAPTGDAAPAPTPAPAPTAPQQPEQMTVVPPPTTDAGAQADATKTGPAEAGPAGPQGATTQPDNPQVAAGKATTQPASAEATFDKLEADFAAASGKTIEQQPVTELLGGYKQLISNPQLPESMRRVADFRVSTLNARAEAREQFVAMQKQQEEAKKKLAAFRVEQEEIAQQIKKTDVLIYTAVGTLRTSSIQQGNQLMYRLTDPQTSRTVCYVRSDDPKYASFLGQFIGVKGDLTTDPALNLKVVTATEAAAVDPNQVFREVSSQIVPPSLLPNAQVAQQAGGAAE